MLPGIEEQHERVYIRAKAINKRETKRNGTKHDLTYTTQIIHKCENINTKNETKNEERKEV